LNGKVALVEQPKKDLDFASSVIPARDAGAAAAIIFTQGANLPISLASIGFPVFGVFSEDDGITIREWVQQHPAAPVLLTPLIENEAPGDVVAYFSSVGPSALGSLKPDVDAPGTFVFTAWPRTVLGYLIVSGTSFAAPHVSGAAALLKQMHPSWTPEQIKSALMSSADPVFTNSLKIEVADDLRAGSGRIDLSRAGAVTATFSPPSLSFGFQKLKRGRFLLPPLTADLRITNVTSDPAVYSLSIQQPTEQALIKVDLSAGSLSLGAGESATVRVVIDVLSAAANDLDFTGVVLVQGPSGDTLHVPYWVRFGRVKN
jgi:minor extracellular serine protease Vpr